jgi:hypothetical protein
MSILTVMEMMGLTLGPYAGCYVHQRDRARITRSCPKIIIKFY